jgi:hypothetical protein
MYCAWLVLHLTCNSCLVYYKGTRKILNNKNICCVRIFHTFMQQIRENEKKKSFQLKKMIHFCVEFKKSNQIKSNSLTKIVAIACGSTLLLMKNCSQETLVVCTYF